MTGNSSLMPSVSTNSEVTLLFERVARIVESGRGRVLRAVNHETVLANWPVGREIVRALRGGEASAQYGDALIAELSKCLSERYGTGFSTINLRDIRQFFLANADRSVSISHPSGSELAATKGLDPTRTYPQRGRQIVSRAEDLCVATRELMDIYSLTKLGS